MDDLAKYLGKYAFFYSEFWKVKKKLYICSTYFEKQNRCHSLLSANLR